MIESILSIVATVLGWFGAGKAPDGPSPEYTSGEAAGSLRTANDNQDRVLKDVEKARAVERSSDADRLRNADPLGPDKYRRD